MSHRRGAVQFASFQTGLDKKGVLDTSDTTRLNSISVQLSSTHTLTDPDLDYWINLLQHGPPNNNSMNRYQFYALVMGDMDSKMNLTPSQRNKLYTAILPYVYAKTYQSSQPHVNSQTAAQLAAGSQVTAMQILAHTKDPRALPVLKSLAATGENLKVRSEAKSLYDALKSYLH